MRLFSDFSRGHTGIVKLTKSGQKWLIEESLDAKKLMICLNPDGSGSSKRFFSFKIFFIYSFTLISKTLQSYQRLKTLMMLV